MKITILTVIGFSLFLAMVSIELKGQLIQLTTSDSNEYHPRWSPDGLSMAYTTRSPDYVDICVLLLENDIAEPTNLDMDGDLAFDWSPDGNYFVFDAYPEAGPPANIYTFSLTTGDVTELTNYTMSENHPTWSPDGNSIAFTWNGGIWTIPANGGNPENLTSGYDDFHLQYSPDGSEILFASNRSGNHDIWKISSAGGTPVQLTFHQADDDRACWSPNGNSIAFGSERSGNDDVWTKNLVNGVIEQITFHDAYDSHPDWSTDGSKIVFASLRTGNFDVWVIDLNSIGYQDKILQNNNTLQNYPNPFTYSTTIYYTLIRNSHIRLIITDSSGKVVVVLVDELKKPGNHSIIWNGANSTGEVTSPGIYYAKICVNNKSDSIKILKVD
ncbi:MAG: T9SS type A sorting domain-containing protein [Bacteroidales bacterium]|nr:T9SS type A sorting domain-containing protein [Bacteroidales bacterium]